jgi:toxin ParE1/3/4
VTDYVLSRQAAADLDEIWDYTAKTWGREQANRYVEGLRQSMRNVAGDPSRGRSIAVGRKSFYRYRSGSHLMFYRQVGQGVRIVRILHESMDHKRHLR